MPSEYTRRQFTSWFKKIYPQEYCFFNKIESNLGKLYSNHYLALNDCEFAEISIQIRKLEGDKYHLASNQYGAIFLGSLFKTILEEFSSNMESIVSKKIKDEFESKLAIKCSNCENLNLSGSRYCNNCGTGLDDVSTNHRKSER